jgi:hypothetical protein
VTEESLLSPVAVDIGRVATKRIREYQATGYMRKADMELLIAATVQAFLNHSKELYALANTPAASERPS